MKRHRHTPEQIVRKLREGDRLLNEGKDLTEVLRHLEIAESTWNRWRAQYGGMKADEAKRLRQLETENARLRHGACPATVLTPRGIRLRPRRCARLGRPSTGTLSGGRNPSGASFALGRVARLAHWRSSRGRVRDISIRRGEVCASHASRRCWSEGSGEPKGQCRPWTDFSLGFPLKPLQFG